MTTVGAAVHIHLEGATQTHLVCVWGGGDKTEGRSGIVYIKYSLKAKPFDYIIMENFMHLYL